MNESTTKTIKVKRKDGTIEDYPFEKNGYYFDESGAVQYDPQKDQREKPELNKQIDYLIGFIETFKNSKTPEQITDFVKFMIGSIVGDTPEKLNEIIETVEKAKQTEKEEADRTIIQNPDAVYSDLPHNGFAILCRVLDELKTLPEEERQEELTIIAQRYPKGLNSFVSRPMRSFFGEILDGMGERLNYDTELAIVSVYPGVQKLKNVTVTLGAYYYANNQKIPRYFDDFDQSVFETVCSFYESKCYRFTASNVAEMMGYNSRNKQIIDKINCSIESMMSTLFRTDMGKWLEAKQVKNFPYESEISTNMLDLVHVRFTQNGIPVDGYQFKAPIYLLELHNVVGGLVRIPRKLLDLPIQATDKSIRLCKYLAVRVELMKNNRNSIKSNEILFSTLYDLFGITTKALQQNLREQIFSILNYWTVTPSLQDLQKTAGERMFEPWEENRYSILKKLQTRKKGSKEPLNYISSYEIVRDKKGVYHSIKLKPVKKGIIT